MKTACGINASQADRYLEPNFTSASVYVKNMTCGEKISSSDLQVLIRHVCHSEKRPKDGWVTSAAPVCGW